MKKCAHPDCNIQIPIGTLCAIHKCSFIYERCNSKTVVPGLCAKHKSLVEQHKRDEQDKRNKKCKRDEQRKLDEKIEDDDSSSDCSYSSSYSSQDVEDYIYNAESLAEQGLLRIPFEDYTILSSDLVRLNLSLNEHGEATRNPTAPKESTVLRNLLYRRNPTASEESTVPRESKSTEKKKPWDHKGSIPEAKYASESHPAKIWINCDKSRNPRELERVKKYYVESIVRDGVTYWCEFIKVEEGRCRIHNKDIDIIQERYVHYGYGRINTYKPNCGCPPIEEQRNDSHAGAICKEKFYQ